MDGIDSLHHDLNLRPGEIWLIETEPAGLSAFAHHALASADVIFYERGLASLAAARVPRGRYAEPVDAPGADGAAVIPARALRLAADGWRVVLLVPGCRDWRQQLRGAVAALPRSSHGGQPSAWLITQPAAHPFLPPEAQILELRAFDDAAVDAPPLALVIGPLASGAITASGSFTANGLAG